jgi:hypothetical protein
LWWHLVSSFFSAITHKKRQQILRHHMKHVKNFLILIW